MDQEKRTEEDGKIELLDYIRTRGKMACSSGPFKSIMIICSIFVLYGLLGNSEAAKSINCNENNSTPAAPVDCEKVLASKSELNRLKLSMAIDHAASIHGSALTGIQSLPDESKKSEISASKRNIRRRWIQSASASNVVVGPSGHQTAPKLIQWAKEPIRYYEGSTLVLSCSLAISQPSGSPPLKFTWFKQSKPLMGLSNTLGPSNHRLSVENLPDYSFLRLTDLRASDSGAYSCAASNSLGQEDRTTAQVLVNVKLHWLPISTDEMSQSNGRNTTVQFGNGNQLETLKAGQSIAFECAAAGEPKPRIRWYKLIPAITKDRSSSAFGKHRLQSNSHPMEMPTYQKLDETQIRAALMQAGDFQFASHLRPIELPIQQQVKSDSNDSNSRWRIESIVVMETLESRSRLLTDRLDVNQNGLYLCEAESHSSSSAGSSADPSSSVANGEKLHKMFGLLVNASKRLRGEWKMEIEYNRAVKLSKG